MKPEPLGLPAAGFAAQSEHRHPGRQIEGDLPDFQPDPVLCNAVQRKVAQAGVAGGAPEVLDPATWLTASGGGIVVDEHRAEDQAMADLLAPLTPVLAADRACLAALFGNRTNAVSVHATVQTSGSLSAHGAVFAPGQLLREP